MGLFDLFKPRRYDMDTLEGINAIPVPAKDYHTGDPTKDCIYYLLQRKATEHKKNGHMDLAIACLRKSNELSDHERRPLLTQKEYMRLVKYIEATGDMQTALLETERIYKKHPEFLDKRVTNKLRFSEAIQKAQKNGTDLLYITTNNHCPVCKNYNHKIFSISGKSKDYPKLPKEFLKDGGFDESCIVGVSLKII